MVEHMDEVLSHALILAQGDTLFRKDDISLAMLPENKEMGQRAPLI